MKVSTILDQIDSGHIALPEFQRGYVWNRDQVRGLFASLYRRHPVGGLLVWATESDAAPHRGDGPPAAGVGKLLLDGQQRMTSIYGVVRGKAPRFFDGYPQIFSGLHFHLKDEEFSFYRPTVMQNDPLWVDVTKLMQENVAVFMKEIMKVPEYSGRFEEFMNRLNDLYGIQNIVLHIEEVTGQDKTLDIVVDIFNRVNSGGTKLSKGDLALARICAEWPDARSTMKDMLEKWSKAGYEFTLDWLLRSVNTVLTGEAKFVHLRGRDAESVQNGLKLAEKHIDTILNTVAGRLGLDHSRVFFGRFAVPVMVRYLDKAGTLDVKERDKLLFWFAQAGMWGRFSASTETVIDQDIEALEGNGLDGLLERLRLWHGDLTVRPDHFSGWSLGARFYPVLYMLSRMGEAKDLGTGLPLKADMLGPMNRLEVHHIFPKSRLYEANYYRAEVNALANFCFLTKDTNIDISNRFPEDYFPEVERCHPRALASQWIPEDPALWKIDRYPEFLEARRCLLAAAANRRMEELLHGDTRWLVMQERPDRDPEPKPVGGISSELEERQLEMLNDWTEHRGLARGVLAFDYADPQSGEQKAIFDLAWPEGVQPGLSQPVAVLLNETANVLALASEAGFRCFTSIPGFRAYIEAEILKSEAA